MRQQRISFSMNIARLESERLTRLYIKFRDSIDNNPYFKYSVRDFSRWLQDQESQ